MHPAPILALIALAAPDDATEVARVVDAFVQATARRDVAAARTVCHEDVVVYEGAMINRGLVAFVKDHLEPELKAIRAIAYARVSNDVHLCGDTAWVAQEAEVTVTDAAGKKRTRTAGTTYVLVRTDKGWKIRHLHW